MAWRGTRVEDGPSVCRSIFLYMAVPAALRRSRLAIDPFLIRSLPRLPLVGLLGAALRTVQISRSVLGHIGYQQSVPALLIDGAYLLYLSWVELRWFLGSDPEARTASYPDSELY